jgi:hypothetical protein
MRVSVWRSGRPGPGPSAARPSLVWRSGRGGRCGRAADGGGEPGPGGQLAGGAEPGDVAGLGEDDQGSELAHAGQLGEHLHAGLGLGPLADLGVQGCDRAGQGIDQRQVILDHLAGSGRQVQAGQPGAAGAARLPGRAVIAVVGGDGVDPVAHQGAQPHQLDAVAQQCAQRPHLRRGDPRLGEQVGAQELRQGGRAGLCRFSASPRQWPCTAAGAPGAPGTRSPPAARPATPSRTRPRTRPGCLAARRQAAPASTVSR